MASKGWVPNYHGAWAMIIVPPFVGTILSSFHLEHLLLLAVWWIGYFAFFSTGLWLRSRRKPRYRTPVIVYGALTALAGLPLAILVPELLIWVPVFLPLIVITFFQSLRRKDRSLINNTVTVVAAGLLTPVAFHLATVLGTVPTGRFGWEAWEWMWLATASITAYFIGTAFYVKTNIRERGNEGFFWLAVAYHAVFAAAATVLAVMGVVPILHALVWWVVTFRTWAVATYSRKIDRRVSPKAIGMWEVVTTLAMTGSLLI
ncbi:YwiC-like family protein [Flaviflexus huanghaiensis]|uniref:YwiC-like family protein n=1 Tax=Flaviflexus huanghaiensis TaxID=1111473 RepID=UPI0015F7C711|nr:YwiC-like family protein [Flaviflexus huanghaiensis]